VDINLELLLGALAEPTRREIYERVVIRPRRVGELADGLPVARPAVSHHVKMLREAGLVEVANERLEIVPGVLPELRMYFDRLWLEASLGDSWLARRQAENSDYGL
jgi:DNA-binding transcriptional ArsR family regulator